MECRNSLGKPSLAAPICNIHLGLRSHRQEDQVRGQPEVLSGKKKKERNEKKEGREGGSTVERRGVWREGEGEDSRR